MAVRTPGAGLPTRPRLLGPVVLVVALILVLAAVGVSLFTDLLWYREVGFSRVFTTTLTTKLLLFALFGVLMAVLVGTNIAVAYRMRPPFRPMSLEQQNLERYRVAVEPYLTPALLLISGVFGVFAGLSAAGKWQTWLMWRNATPFGIKDPQFHRDISYYAFTYPMQRFVLAFVIAAVILSLVASAATHYLFGGVRLQTAGEKVSPAARAHLSVLVGILVLFKAVAYYLDRFGLAFSLRGRVEGASYTDIYAVLPAKSILVGVAVICAGLFFANIRVRNVLLPAGALGLLVVSAVVIGGIYPAYTQQFRVKPNEINREAPYIQRNIDATRAAYQIDKAQLIPFTAQPDVPLAALAKDTATIPHARVLDPNVVSPTFLQFQRLRSYFGFNSSLDIDRYLVNGNYQDFVVGVRELNKGGLSPDQQNWINEHLIYTHGNGFVAAAANKSVDAAADFAVGNLPPSGPNNSTSPIPITESRIYYGEGTTDYSIVKTQQPETDGPTAGTDATYKYLGNGGVQLSSVFRKLAYAIKFRDKNLLLSGSLTNDSRLMYIRTPRERVQKVAPFLQLDQDPYPAVIGGRILWIVDGYTTSDGYPYSQRTLLGSVTADSHVGGLAQAPVNYIRNSVKATVDAFTGKVTLYKWDEKDPVLKTWNKAFGGILRPKNEISPELQAHLRYPEDLFKVQRDLLGKYHITQPKAFFQGDDYWQIPADPISSSGTASASLLGSGATPNVFNSASTGPDQPPYYLLYQFPGTSAPAFSLTTSFVARRAPNLTAFASVSSDPGDYGTIRVLQLPDSSAVPGPGQEAGNFQSTSIISSTLTLLGQQGSAVEPGNLLTLPVGGGLLYLEPIYVKASKGESYPTLRYVIAAFNGKIVFEPTLGGALTSLFGSAPSVAPGVTPPSGGGTVTSSPELAAALADARQALADGAAALAKGDFAAYGDAQKRLAADIQRASAAAAKASPSASPRPRASSPGPSKSP